MSEMRIPAAVTFVMYKMDWCAGKSAGLHHKTIPRAEVVQPTLEKGTSACCYQKQLTYVLKA